MSSRLVVGAEAPAPLCQIKEWIESNRNWNPFLWATHSRGERDRVQYSTSIAVCIVSHYHDSPRSSTAGHNNSNNWGWLPEGWSAAGAMTAALIILLSTEEVTLIFLGTCSSFMSLHLICISLGPGIYQYRNRTPDFTWFWFMGFSLYFHWEHVSKEVLARRSSLDYWTCVVHTGCRLPTSRYLVVVVGVVGDWM